MIKIGNIELSEFPFLLAPMEDVSDPPFRRLCKMHGADLMYSEFISSEGLIRDAMKSKKKLDIFDYERPIGIQIFGGDEEAMSLSAKIVETVQPDLVDINFGCPVKKVACKGAGAGVLKDVNLMVRLTQAVVKSTHLPVTVKTRLGWDDSSINIDEVAERLQDVGIQALTIHARTRSQMYKGHSDWSHIARIKNNPRIKIPVFGNGDINSPEKAKEYKETYGVDGIMIGRAAIGNPWIFNQIKHYLKTGELLPLPTLNQRIEAVKNHVTWSIEWKGERTGLLEMRQHYSNYFRGIDNFKSYKTQILSALTWNELERIFTNILDKNSI
ncbi:tRNA dihydrouridine synthase DusB [Apibacter sp. HY039]|uniref:tRNA dihydrouridine synthase DusB n=1 Tax=Apibacter sp. HY039 TaxID=2501476 RepID=UPI000FEBB64B|nr:tRNA dihydrouridine synthase DusB [Apibacter sp. HY039]